MNIIKNQFPIFAGPVRGKNLCFLDSAASAQKPLKMLQAMENAHRQYYANVHRGAYFLSEESTAQYELARHKIAQFINAKPNEIVFTMNATMGFNFLTMSFAHNQLQAGDGVMLTIAEHHANIVPWQLLQQKLGIKLYFAPITPDGVVDMDYLAQHLPQCKIFAFNYVSNVLGAINPVHELCAMAKNLGVYTIIDAAQALPHIEHINVKAIDCDFMIGTGHKLYGPTGIGFFYGRAELLHNMPPVFGGGDMIEQVTINGTSYAPPPARFEAGTPNFVGAIGLAAAIDFMGEMGDFSQLEQKLADELYHELRAMNNIRLLSPAKNRIGLVSFVVDGVHPHDIATLLDQQGVCLRAGLHCAEPLAKFLGVNGSLRASFGMYNDADDIQQFLTALHRALRILGGT